jgi:hypothetical protein
METLREAIYSVTQVQHPMTVRQVFYQLVAIGAIEKTEAEYKQTVVRLVTLMRRNRDLPFGWISDSTRWMRKPRTYSSLEDMLTLTAETYRRALWGDQEVYTEIWLEKDALAGVLYQETERYDVPLMVTRGYPSLSYLYEAAEAIGSQNKPAFLYYFGDYDPSGLDITRTVERGIREFARGADIYFERVAVTREQIERLKLPTRPTKKTDSRSKNFTGESVEVDAIPPTVLRGLVKECIEKHVDRRALARTQRIEAAERETLVTIQQQMQGWQAS